jgi:hypothetical protein
VIIDYLRYVAFRGRLRGFFTDGFYNYVEPLVSTGQHLRFAPDYIEERLGWRGQTIVRDLHWDPHARDLIFEELKQKIGLLAHANGLNKPQFKLGEAPPTVVYLEIRPPRLEIIIDIHPDHWSERYSEGSTYEDIPIIYRRSGPAKSSFKTGDKVLDVARTNAGHGTLCGIFCSPQGAEFALTCGHGISPRSRVSIAQPRRMWKLPLWSHVAILGETRHHTMCRLADRLGSVQTHLDAALIEFRQPWTTSKSPKPLRQASVKPLSSVLQEEPVAFRGADRRMDTLARVSAVTVRKSIDLLKNGELHAVGDVLMLGHRQPMYIVQPVSRPGDSGAAVRQGFSFDGSVTNENQWYGMILGGDETSAYASHAEAIWAWATQATGDPDLDFVFET